MKNRKIVVIWEFILHFPISQLYFFSVVLSIPKSARLGSVTNWSKILISRNPFERLYSAWNDKSRTFRSENGKLNFTKVELESTFLWGKENATHQEKLHIIFNQVRQQSNHWKVYENLINKGSGFDKNHIPQG